MSLKQQLLRRIAVDGPLSIADYMAEALMHPQHGYYATRDPFGAGGDFTTAPEISQMFGELLGMCLAQSWLDQGAPSPFTLAELGPGRGTLMRDALRATARVPGFAPEIHLVEGSETLRQVQSETLRGPSVTWHDTIHDLPQQPLFLIANEFFDALPIRQFQRSGPGWREVRIGADGDTLIRGLAQEQAQPLLGHRLEDTAQGDIVELCPALPDMVQAIGQRIGQHGGAALIVDYGDWRSLGDTWQALLNHQPTDPLADPGQADLTAHVDFEAIAQAVALDATRAATRATTVAAHTRVTPQGVFLERLGITERANTLANTLSGPAQQTHIAAHRRLTHPDEMGNLFKVIGIYPDSAVPPPGLVP